MEKEFNPLHFIVVSFLVALAPSSSSKRISKYPCVSRVVQMNEDGRWNLKQPWKTLIVVLPFNVLPIIVLRTFQITFS